MFKLSLATAMAVAVNAEGTAAENLWDTSENGPFNMNTCAGELASLSNTALKTVEYITSWLYCNNDIYTFAGIDFGMCGAYASASYGYLAKTLGTSGKAMTFCFANPVWGPCFSYMGYANAHLGATFQNIFSALLYCKTEAEGGDGTDCADNVLNSVLNAGQATWYTFIALDYCIESEVMDVYADEDAQFDFKDFNACDYTEEEISAIAEEYGFDPAEVNYDEC